MGSTVTEEFIDQTVQFVVRCVNNVVISVDLPRRQALSIETNFLANKQYDVRVEIGDGCNYLFERSNVIYVAILPIPERQ